MLQQVKIKLLSEDAIVPTYGTDYAAGADLYALIEDVQEFKPGETKLIKTGIAVEIPDGYVGLIYARSGLASKKGLAPANKVGVVDSDYRGEIMVALHNHSNETRQIEKGERIAQFVITPYLKAEYVITAELEDSKRGTGGFGSTGNK